MRKILFVICLMLTSIFIHAQEWQIGEYPNSMNFAIENGYYKYEKVDIKNVPQTAIAAIQKVKELNNNRDKNKIIYKGDDPQTVISSLKQVRDLHGNGGWYTWFMNSDYMYMYVCYTIHDKEAEKENEKNKNKQKNIYKDLYYLVVALR